MDCVRSTGQLRQTTSDADCQRCRPTGTTAIVSNSAWGGAALRCAYGSNTRVENTVISGNYGGAVRVHSAYLQLINCLVTGNGGEPFFAPVISASYIPLVQPPEEAPGSIVMLHCTVSQNLSVSLAKLSAS